MTRMALDMYTILPAPPTINFNLVDWQAQDAISAPTQIVITLQLINHSGTNIDICGQPGWCGPGQALLL